MKMLSGLISCEGLTVLANRWPSSPVSSWSALYVCIQGFPSYTDIIALGPHLMTSFNLNFLFKDLISQYIHIGKYWKLEIQHMTFGMTKFSPQHLVAFSPSLSFQEALSVCFHSILYIFPITALITASISYLLVYISHQTHKSEQNSALFSLYFQFLEQIDF